MPSFGNLNNLKFLCENGRIHKFANSFCALAFMLQEYKQQSKDGLVEEKLYLLVSDVKDTNTEYHGYWKNYVVKLSKVLTAFLLALEDSYSHDFPSSAGKPTLPVSSVYGELSVKWIMRVLLTVFPCIEACSNQNQLPNYLRWLIHLYVLWSILLLPLQFAGCSIVPATLSMCYNCFLCYFWLFFLMSINSFLVLSQTCRLFVYVLQHHVLFVLRKVLILSPSQLDVFRSEGVWDFIFSENFFYFGSVSAECVDSYSEILPWDYVCNLDPNLTDHQINSNEIEILQTEVISTLEFAATLTGNSHNLVRSRFSFNPCFDVNGVIMVKHLHATFSVLKSVCFYSSCLNMFKYFS